MRSEGFYVNEIPLTPAGIEPGTFRFVAQHLNHCDTAPPPLCQILDRNFYLLISNSAIVVNYINIINDNYCPINVNNTLKCPVCFRPKFYL